MSIDDNRVEPLYKHVFPPALAPGLSFVGLPGMVSLNRNSFIGFKSLTSNFDILFYDQGIQFVMFEIQSKWVAAVLSGRVTLPSPEMMMEDVIASSAMLEALGIPKRHTHKLGKIQVSSVSDDDVYKYIDLRTFKHYLILSFRLY